MKKLIVITMLVLAMLSMAACGRDSGTQDSARVQETSVQTTTQNENASTDRDAKISTPPNGEEVSSANINNAEPPTQINQTVTSETVGVHIDIACDEFMQRLHDSHFFDYTQVGESLWGLWDGSGVPQLVIWTDVSLREFAVISVGNDLINGEVVFIPIKTFGLIDVLLPGEAFIIDSYMSQGTMPWSGITFIDNYDIKRYFVIVKDQSDEFPPYRLIEFQNRTEELPSDWSAWWESN